MTVFISWSGERSKAIALIFEQHLKHVIQGLPTFISDRHIASGTQWFNEISKELRNATFGIICVTPDNVDKPWLNFEAGAIGNQTNENRVAPVAIDMSRDNLPSPLNGYNAVDLNEDGFVRLVKSIFETRPDTGAAWEVIEAAARRQWVDIEAEIAAVPAAQTAEAPDFDMVDAVKEMRGLLRDLVRSSEPRSSTPYEWEVADRRTLNSLRAKIRSLDADAPPPLRFAQPSLGLVHRINSLLAAYNAGEPNAKEELLELGVDPDRQHPLRRYVQDQQALLKESAKVEYPEQWEASGDPTDPA